MGNKKQLKEKEEKNRIPKSILFVVAFCCGIMIAGIGYNGIGSVKMFFTETKALENIYYVINIFAGIVMIVSIVVAVWQYILSSHAEKAKMDNERIQRAIDLSEYYKDNILNRFGVMKYMFQQLGIEDILKGIAPERMKEFNKLELEEVLSKAKQETIKTALGSKEVVDAIMDAEKIYGIKFDLDQYIENDEGEAKVKPFFPQAVMSNVVNSLLNNMEYFAMNFAHETADESVVYQSLHQTYLEAVQLLYYNIAINNSTDGKQLFTNVVDLYKTWYNKSKEHREQLYDKTHDKKGSKYDSLR